VGLILFSDEVEKFIPPRKGRRHVLRVIREVLYFQPQRKGTDIKQALEFAAHMVAHRSIMVLISDFLLPRQPSQKRSDDDTAPLPRAVQTALRQANRRHDLVAVQITDRHELQLPALGRLTLEDAETGELVELNTGDASSRDAFAVRRQGQLNQLARSLRSFGIDSVQLTTDQPYGTELGRFFETREKRRLRG
jgi:uncharacterized protein (DUF58 family)